MTATDEANLRALDAPGPDRVPPSEPEDPCPGCGHRLGRHRGGRCIEIAEWIGCEFRRRRCGRGA